MIVYVYFSDIRDRFGRMMILHREIDLARREHDRCDQHIGQRTVIIVYAMLKVGSVCKIKCRAAIMNEIIRFFDRKRNNE